MLLNVASGDNSAPAFQKHLTNSGMDDETRSRLVMATLNLNAESKQHLAPKQSDDFIPYFSERDHLGRLIGASPTMLSGAPGSIQRLSKVKYSDRSS